MKDRMGLVDPLLRIVRAESRPADADLELAPPVRLTHHVLELGDGHRVGVAVAGSGLPFVLLHGFGVESLLYAQPLARLAALGLRIVAIDVPGHGDSERLGPLPAFGDYAEVVKRAADHLGIRHAVFAGHSMGGRLAAEMAAAEPASAIGVILLDAIVGRPWDLMKETLRFVPPALVAFAGLFLLDTLGTVPVLVDTRQALKLGSRVGRSVELHAVRPWRALAPGQAILRSGSSLPLLERLRDEGVCVAVVHGDRDFIVPYAAGVDAARRSGGELVTVHGGSHSWLLRCPETLPAIVGDLLGGRLGASRDALLRAAGLDPAEATAEEVQRACCTRDALVERLGADAQPTVLPSRRHPPRLRWTVDATYLEAGPSLRGVPKR